MNSYVNGSSSLINNSFSSACINVGFPSGITNVLERRRVFRLGTSAAMGPLSLENESRLILEQKNK